MAGPVAASDRQVAEPGSAAPSGPLRAARARPIAVVVLAVVLVALALLAFLQTLSVRHHDDLSARRSAAVNAASDEVVALLTVRDDSATADLKRLLDGSTAGFHDQLEQQAQTFRQALSQGRVTSSGSIAAAALVSLTGDTAVVAIAAKALVKNASSPAGDPRNYRLTVTVTDVNDTWLVSGLTFVV